MSQTVHDFIPSYVSVEFADLLEKKGDIKILKIVDGTVYRFPSNNYKFVFKWAILENGSVIGWNENPSKGWSFPIIGKRAIQNFYKKNSFYQIPTQLLEFL